MKYAERSLPVYASVGAKYRKNLKNNVIRKTSPYAKLDHFMTIGDKTPKPLPKIKHKPKVNITALQNYFLEFQAKSKLLLQQLEKNVLG